MITGIITGFKEPKTIGRAITNMNDAFIISNVDYEIIILAPDNKTLDAARAYENNKIKIIKDVGIGKPTALNIAFKKAKGEILILTDADVYVCKFAIRELLKKMQDKNIGAVSGCPISINEKLDMYGYWSSLLTTMADVQRKKANGNFVCSGYLYALRSGIIKELPNNCLSDDAYISFKVLESGYKLDYASDAQVFVKYPNNWKDWIMQKKRSTGGYTQLTSEYKMNPKKEMRSMWQEAKGIWDVIAYANTPREVGWTLVLICARIWMWINIFWERKILNKSFEKTWVRIESTK